MPREFIGVVRSADGEIIAVINPTDDSELDDPAYRFDRDDTEMIKVPRGERGDVMSVAEVAELVKAHQR